MRRIAWDAVGALAAVVAAAVATLPYLQTVWRVLAAAVGSVSLVLVVGYLQNRLRPRLRQEIIAAGRAIIGDAHEAVVMFGGDLSWAEDYEQAIAAKRDEGKEVTVVYPAARSGRNVDRNVRLLRKVGARVIATSVECRPFGILIDPEHRTDSRFLVTRRRVRAGAAGVVVGERGTGESSRYWARVFDTRRSESLIEAATSVYRMAVRGEDGRGQAT